MINKIFEEAKILSSEHLPENTIIFSKDIIDKIKGIKEPKKPLFGVMSFEGIPENEVLFVTDEQLERLAFYIQREVSKPFGITLSGI